MSDDLHDVPTFVAGGRPSFQSAYGLVDGSPPLQGRRVSLVSLTPKYYEFLWSMEEALGFRFRFRGTTPSPDAFVSSLWDKQLAAFVLIRRDRSMPVGLVSVYQEDARNGTAFVAVGQHPEAAGRGYGAEGLILLVNYCFSVWNFRKLYAETNEYNISGVSKLRERLFVEEGRFGSHEFYAGRWWDKIIFAAYKERWNELRSSLLRGALPLEASR